MKTDTLASLPRAYANILFIDHPWLGVVIMAASLWYPNVGLAGMLAAGTALITARLFRFANSHGGLHIYNSVLTGLSLGAFYQLNSYLLGLIILGAILAVLLSVVLADTLWQTARLPALSLPFILSVLFTAPVAQRYTDLADYLGLAEPQHSLLQPWLDTFFSTLGSIFFSPQPLVGLLLFLLIFWRSRYLALLALAGYAFGSIIFHLLIDNPHPRLLAWTGFNFSLTAMAVAGFFTVPSLAGMMVALVAVALSAMLVVAGQDLLLLYGLPVMAMPFVITTLLVLSALNKRAEPGRPWPATPPGLPEINYERARLARVRNGEFDSTALLAPFYGEWEIYQGFNGKHTHKESWRHALDFFITENGQSYANNGAQLSDYHCFGLPVLSPAYARVARTFDKLPDNAPGEVDTQNNWGNFILLRLDNGLHVLLAHLRQDSLKVKEGDNVTPGKMLAACGNSGRSPQPHLHLQVQADARLGSPTRNFHLASVVVHDGQQPAEYQLVARPGEGQHVQAAEQDEQLSTPLHLPVGRTLRYQIEGPEYSEAKETLLRVELTLLGQFRLVSDSGASAAFEERNSVLAFYDRQGPQDRLLDIWLLANGLTPLTSSAQHWRDAPNAQWFPLTFAQKLWLWLWLPMGHSIDTRYQRQWDKQRELWRQSGQHQLQLGARMLNAETEAWFKPGKGCVHVKLRLAGQQWQLTLLDSGQLADRGIPGWELPAKQRQSQPPHQQTTGRRVS